MKLCDIIKQIDYLCNIKILQNDAYLETSEHYGEAEEIYVGDALNVPWWIVDMYLDGEGCISVVDNTMIIYVKESANANQDN